MKTFLFNFFAVSLFFCASIDSAKAQTPFTKESKIIHAGFGLGGYGFGSCYSSLPVVNFSYDQGLIDGLGIGNLGVGGIIGVKRYTYDCFGTNFSLNRIFIGARGHYHFDFVNSEQFDFYVGAQAGVFFWTGDRDSNFGSYGTSLLPGAFAGINYWFTPNIGIYGEAGYGLGLLNGGLAISF